MHILCEAADRLLTRREAAAYLRRDVSTLARWARDGIGPKPVRIGRGVYYRLSDLLSVEQK